MGFGAELKGFVSGFRTGVGAASAVTDMRAKREKTRKPKDDELGGGPFGDDGEGVIKEKSGGIDVNPTGSTGSGGNKEARRAAISSIESGGRYDAMGPKTKKGDRAYGKYQMMGANIPSWTKAALGTSMSPEEFLKNPKAQDATFDHIFGGYVDKYGEENAAQAWFGGEGSIGKTGRKDQLGTSVGSYGQRYMKALQNYQGGATTPSAVTPAYSATQSLSEGGDEGDVGAIPEGDEDAAPAGDEEDEDPSTIEPGEVSFALPEVDLPEITPWDEYAAKSTVYAGSGGVIPETHYDGGGTVDPYNPSRAITQGGVEPRGASPAMDARPSFVPRRITQPVLTERPAMGAPTSSQTALRDAKAAAAAKEAADAAAAAKPAANGVPMDVMQMRANDAYKQYMGQGTRMRGNRVSGSGLVNKDLVQEMQQYRTPEGQKLFMDNWIAAAQADPNFEKTWGRGSYKAQQFPGLGYYKAPPTAEPAAFAKGGIVSVNPDYWEKAVARERRPGRDEQEARDIAAKRANRRAGGPTSSAVNVGGGRSGGGDDKRKIREKTAESEPSTAGAPPIDTKAPSTAPGRLSDEYTPPKPATPATPATPSTAPGRLSDEYTPPKEAGVLPDLSRNPYETQRGEGPDQVDQIIDALHSGAGAAADWVTGGAEPEAEGGVLSPIPGVAAPVDAAHDQPRGGTWAPPGPPAPRNVVSPTPVLPEEPALPGGARPSSPKAGSLPARPEPGGGPGGGPGAPALNANAIADIVNEAVAKTQAQGGAGGGAGAPVFNAEALKRLATDAVKNKSERAMAVLKGVANEVDRYLKTQSLENAGAPRSAEPAEPGISGPPGAGPGAPRFSLDSLINMLLTSTGFASGGVVPEEDDEPIGRSPRLESSGYTTSAPGATSASSANAPAPAAVAPEGAPAEGKRKHADVKPTKRLRDDVAKALDGGIKFLTQHFGLGNEGAVPTPEDGNRQQQGMLRFARGEGQATPDEIKGIDDAIDPERQLDEGNRQLNRFAATMSWYKERGRDDEAAAAAGSLLQYGSRRFSQLGSMAANQYEKYMETQDPEYLQGTINMLEQAYKMVPDGANVDVSINPDTRELQITRIDAEGNETDIPITAQQLPQIIQSVQDGSQYWKQVYRIADPEGAKEEFAEKRQIARDERTAKRQEDAAFLRESFAQDRADQRNKETIAAEDRRSKRELEKEARAEKRQIERWRRENPKVDFGAVQSKLGAAKQALKAFEDDDSDENKAAYNAAASELFNELSKTAKYPDKVAETMDSFGIYMDSFDPQAPAGAPGAAPVSPAPEGMPPRPAKYPDAKPGLAKDGKTKIWVVVRDGKPYQVPTGP